MDAYVSYGRATRACGALVALTGVMTLAGWATGRPALASLRANYIPMAPNTALAFIVLGAALVAVATPWRGSRLGAGLAAGVVGLVGVLRLIEYSSGGGFAVDDWFFRVRGGQLGLAPVGKMSLPTAIAFVAASGAVLALADPARWKWSGHTAGLCGLVTGMTGLVFILGYSFSPNSPLLYGTESIPMALNTALSFLCLGVGLVTAAGPAAFPLVRLSGPSIRARLLRIFLPLVVGTVGVVAWLTHLITTTAGSRSAAISSAALAAAAIVLFGVICVRIAGRVGGQIERAESDLQKAHDLLESKVDERTRELSRSNGELATALRETQLAHSSLQQAHFELRQAQSRMMQQARMASLGQTAAGVAHEINNPLCFVTNNLSVLKREVTGLHDVVLLYQQAEETLAQFQHELHAKISELALAVDLPYVLENLHGLVERSQRGLLRIQKIVADLQDFAHLEEAEFKEADLNDGISTTVRLMQTLAGAHRVTLETSLAPIPRLTCFPAKLNLVFQSLISNAIDACPNGGSVVVETRTVEAGIEIRVSDNGHGIAPAIRDRIFDPFFTTKPVGKGTGLGLSISYGIIKDHGGSIDFESRPGQGTQFTITIPVAPPDETVHHLERARVVPEA
jgi:two-component system NtrC family sensor kinase